MQFAYVNEAGKNIRTFVSENTSTCLYFVASRRPAQAKTREKFGIFVAAEDGYSVTYVRDECAGEGIIRNEYGIRSSRPDDVNAYRSSLLVVFADNIFWLTELSVARLMHDTVLPIFCPVFSGPTDIMWSHSPFIIVYYARRQHIHHAVTNTQQN